MKKIIIFGISGNTGPYVLDYFIKKYSDKYELIGVDIMENKFVEEHCKFVKANIDIKDDFNIIPSQDVYAVIDLVGPMPARMLGYHPEKYVKTNILGTFNIIQFCIEKSVDRLLYARSFCDILMSSERDMLLRVDQSPEFDYSDEHAVYAVSQISAVELIKCMHAYYGLKTFVFRLPHIYLWSDNDSYSVNGVPVKMMHRIIIDNAIEGKPIEVWGDPTRKKDMVYVKDFAYMLYLACEANRDEGFYNVGTGVGTPLIDQIKGIIGVFDEKKTSTLIMCPEKNNAPQYIMDISDARRELGYEPQYTYLSMLEDMNKERLLHRF